MDRTLSLDTERTIFKVDAGVWDVRRSNMPRGDDVKGASWNALDELLFLVGMFDDKFCLHPFTSSLEQLTSCYINVTFNP